MEVSVNIPDKKFAEKTRKKRWQKVVLFLSAVVVFCTTYALILPAITKESRTCCGMEEHLEHTESCYGMAPVCGLEECEGHIHTENCMGVACLLEETPGHTHTAECGAQETRRLVCGLEECEGHTHGDECCSEPFLTCEDNSEEHVHDESCYSRTLICTLAEQPGHVHGEDCYETETVYACGLDETPGHAHGDGGCIMGSTILCGLEEKEGHQHTEACMAEGLICGLPIHSHTLQCFSDPDADLENLEVWARSASAAKLSGDWNEDVPAVAETQLGCGESELNYEVQSDGATVRGISRYGQWYGQPYDDWAAMFCSFCLNYAKVDKAAMPFEADCRKWAELLRSDAYQLYRSAESGYVPMPGDLVFFDFDEFDSEHPEKRKADHMGIVMSFDESEGELLLKTIEGDYNGSDVGYRWYKPDNKTIMGFGQLPINPDSLFRKSVIIENGIVVTLEAPLSSLPFPAEEVEMTARLLEDSSAKDIVNNRLGEEGMTPADMVLVDVCLLHDGEEFEPVGPVNLSFETMGVIKPSAVFHVNEKEETLTDMGARIHPNGVASLGTDHFSTYAIVNAGNGKNVTAKSGINVGDDGVVTQIQIAASCSDQENMYFRVERYADSAWTRLSDWTGKTAKNNLGTITILDLSKGIDLIGTLPADTQLRAYGSTNQAAQNSGATAAFTIGDILNEEKSGFTGWLALKGEEPAAVDDLLELFTEFVNISTSVSAEIIQYAGAPFLSCTVTDMPDGGSLEWQYQDADNVWQTLNCGNPYLANASALSAPTYVRCIVRDGDSEPVAVSDSLFVNPHSSVSNLPGMNVTWDDSDSGNPVVGSLQFTGVNNYDREATVKIKYSDGSGWTDGASTSAAQKSGYTLTDSGTVVGAPLNRQWKVNIYKDGNNQNDSGIVTIFEILDACKPGFCEWLRNNYVQDGWGAALPTTQSGLFGVFDTYYSFPEITVSTYLYAGKVAMTYDQTDPEGSYTYQWQYKDGNGVWQNLSPAPATPSQVFAADYSALQGGKDVRCLMFDSNNHLVSVSNTMPVDPNDTSGDKPAITATWDPEHKKISSLTVEVTATQDNAKGYIQTSADGGTTWVSLDSGTTLTKNTATALTLPDVSVFDTATMNTQWRSYWETLKGGNVDKSGYSDPIDLFDILEACKVGFNNWLTNEYVDKDLFNETAPQTKDQLFNAFDKYWGLPVISLDSGLQGGNLVLSANLPFGYTGANIHFRWEYFDEGDNKWKLLETTENTQLNASAYSSISAGESCHKSNVLDGGKNVRCILYEGNSLTKQTCRAVASLENVNPLKQVYESAIEAINTGLHLNGYPVQVGSTANGKNGSVSLPSYEYDVSIGGEQYTKWFYWENLKNDTSKIDIYSSLVIDEEFKDDRVCDMVSGSGTPGENYADYLASVYLSYDDASDGLAAVEKIWKRFLFDIYDPLWDTGNYDSNYSYCTDVDPVDKYGPRNYGDPSKANIKDKNNTSFHGTAANLPVVKELNYNFLDDGVDYANFVSGLSKWATAVKAGDANTERKYQVNLEADAQAMVVAPVVMVMQIQTSWQMFDLTHANAPKLDGDNVEKGAVAVNTEMANLYAIKGALLQFVDYMHTHYPGNNLFLGITETRHDTDQTMFYTTRNSHPLYITNDYQTLRNGIVNWDTFGNCEHVHYTYNFLKDAVEQLVYNLEGLVDNDKHNIYYDQIQKVAVIIGGATENDNGTNGYGCTLPWDTFRSTTTFTRDGKQVTAPILNSVYGIRVNEGVLSDAAPSTAYISWIENSANNGTPFHDGAGSGFTEKYVATTQAAILNRLIQIAETEMTRKGLKLDATDKFVDSLTVKDVVQDEFRMDPDAPITAVVKTKDGEEIARVVITNWDKNKGRDGVKVKWYDENVPNGRDVPDPKLSVTHMTRNGVENIQIKFPGLVFVPGTGEAGPGGQDRYEFEGEEHTLTIGEDKGTGTTEITYDFGRVFNTQKAKLSFGLVAREDYLGSNNVFTNVDTPSLSYVHYEIDKQGNPTGKHDEYTRVGTDTPQVNVPLEFTVEDGGEKTVIYDANNPYVANLTRDVEDEAYEADLHTDGMSTVVEDLIDNYDQTNGALSYTWLLPDGTRAEVGSVRVEHGAVVGELPDLSCEYTVSSPERKNVKLEVKFTPDTVDASGHFYQDDITPVAVDPKTHEGNLWIGAVSPDTRYSIYVRKVWKDCEPTGAIQFRLSDGKGGYLATDSETSGWTITDSAENAEIFTLSATDAVTADGKTFWQKEFRDLPPIKTVDGRDVVLAYQPEEIVPGGCKVLYSSTTQTDEVYDDELWIKVTPGDKVPKDKGKFLHFTYTYNNVTVSEDISISLTADIGAGSEKRFDTGIHLTLADGKPISAVTVSDVYTYEKLDKNSKPVTVHNCTAAAGVDLESTRTSPVLVMTNSPARNDIFIQKVDQTLNPISFEGATFVLYENVTEDGKDKPAARPMEKLMIKTDPEGEWYESDRILTNQQGMCAVKDLDIGAKYWIWEIRAPDGYLIMTEPAMFEVKAEGINADALYNDKYLSADPNNPLILRVKNTNGYELPSTGGIGTCAFTAIGLTLILAAWGFGIAGRRRRQKEA